MGWDLEESPSKELELTENEKENTALAEEFESIYAEISK